MKPQISQSRENVDDNFFEINGIYYKKNDSGETLSVTYSPTKYTGAINIPASVTYKGTSYPVISIGDWAFKDCLGLSFITIPDTVISIGDWAFKDCLGLTSVTIPDSVIFNGRGAFEGCSNLTSINYKAANCHQPNRHQSDYLQFVIDDFYLLEEYGPEARFKGCPLTTLNIGEGVKKIPEYLACNQKGLTTVTIPDSVTSIGDCAFEGCSGLTSVTIPVSVTSIGKEAVKGCSDLTTVTIPDSVTSIGDGAFVGCSGLTSVIIGGSVTSIGKEAFSLCI